MHTFFLLALLAKPEFFSPRFFQELLCRDFPGGPVVKIPPSNAGDTGSVPGWGIKIPHALGATKPIHQNKELMPPNK